MTRQLSHKNMSVIAITTPSTGLYEEDYIDYEELSTRLSLYSKRKRKSFENYIGNNEYKNVKRAKEQRARKKSMRSRSSKTLQESIENINYGHDLECIPHTEDTHTLQERVSESTDSKEYANEEQTLCSCELCVEDRNREAIGCDGSLWCKCVICDISKEEEYSYDLEENHEDLYSDEHFLSDDEYPDRCVCEECCDYGIPCEKCL